MNSMNDNMDRITDILREYWEEKKGNAPYPDAAEINASELEQIWDDCFMVEVIDGGKEFKYEYLGANVGSAYAADMEGQEVIDDMLYPESPETLVKLRETMQGCEPLEYEGALINRDNDDIKFRKILLPLGSGGKVKFILGGMRWRAF